MDDLWSVGGDSSRSCLEKKGKGQPVICVGCFKKLYRKDQMNFVGLCRRRNGAQYKNFDFEPERAFDGP